MVFMTYDLRGSNIPLRTSQIDVELKLLDRSDIDAYLRFRPDTSRRKVEERFDRGHRCFAALHSGNLVDTCWSAVGTVYVDYLEREIDFAEGDIYSFDSFTAPEYRGRGVYMARNTWQGRLNQAEGFARSVALVAYENYAAWLLLSRYGLKAESTYHYIRIPRMGIRWQTS